MELELFIQEFNLVLDGLFNFVQTDDEIFSDFDEYVKTIGGANKSSFTELAVPYIFERHLPDKSGSIIDIYLAKTAGLPENIKNILTALNKSISSIFEIKRLHKHGLELFNLINEKNYNTVYPFKMNNLRGLGIGQFLVGRVFLFEDVYYLIDISGALQSSKKAEAMRFAVAKIIREPQLVYLDNKEKELELETNVKQMSLKFKEAFGTDILFTLSSHSDEIISRFNDYVENGTPVNLDGLIEDLPEYKYFEVKDYNTNYNNFIENSVTGFYNKKEVYDVAITFVEDEGLYIVPFYKSLERILSSKDYENIENYDKCIRYFLEVPTISAKILFGINEKYPNFVSVVNKVLNEDLTFDEIILKYKKCNQRMFSHTTILYNSKAFSSTLVNIVDESKKKDIDYSKVKRNELCPCGSGKKYKNCCLK